MTKTEKYTLNDSDVKLINQLIESNNYRIRITRRLDPLWTMYEAQVRGFWGWKSISKSNNESYIDIYPTDDLIEAKKRILTHYAYNTPKIEYFK